ncbi:Ubiquinone/menaquinone biosynthesis C-methylase UbiE [Actinacidiphila rubida]|uniref:Ubiquinone/menaquinone biosynthesis C-methylase UbiE n=2 Tax=Actinacidiphila rubida TaxID=310780 RepID=A0A1H8KDN4_9ACTN|nr:class I SAM-dependent methyltransferase [Actinacidiphila rubida]SEN90666.1 Ubiquinone/menaquinone biosynthesis C-methylase UbiE [Actinacidiphila rubida]
MHDEVRFAPDLYQGTSGHYDRFRLPYPDAMIDDLLRRAAPSGDGRLLDLACGTGQLAFPLGDRFADVWAVDAEADMTRVVRAQAVAAQADHVRTVTVSAEELRAEPGSFELIVIGNAFHRLRRDLVAQRAHAWLKPGGCLALCWSTSPWAGPRDWQHALAALLRTWQDALGVASRVPAGWEQARQQDPDHEVLSRAGFAPVERHEFTVEHRWTIPELAGHIRSTSFLPPAALGDHAAEFDAALSTELTPYAGDGSLTDPVGFAYELTRRPGPA